MEAIFPGYNIPGTKLSVPDNLSDWVLKYLLRMGTDPNSDKINRTATVQSSTSAVWVVTWSVGN